MRKDLHLLFMAIIIIFLVGCSRFLTGGFLLPVVSDDSITVAINQAFFNNDTLRNVPINVEAYHGNVILSGYVKTIRQSDTAGDIATHVSGVKTVQNNLIVRK